MNRIYDFLYPFQKKVVDKALHIDKYGLFLDMGLGKTFTSLSIAQEVNLPNLLIVCQPSKMIDWADDIAKHFDLPITFIGQGKAKDEKSIADYKGGCIITSHTSGWRREGLLKLIDEDTFVIVDESQYMKTRSSKNGKWGVKLSQKVKRLLLLSGTPMTIGYQDYYNQLKILGSQMKYSEFEENFIQVKLVKHQYGRFPQIIGYKNIDVLKKGLNSIGTFMKTKEAIELPKQVFSDIVIQHDKPKVYQKIQKYSMYKELEIPTPAVLFGRLRQFSSGFIEEYKDISTHKELALEDFLESNTDNAVVFYNYNVELEQVIKVAKKLGIKVFQLNGHTKDYKESVKYDKRYIIASQYISGAEGHNLQHLNRIVYYSPPISFGIYSQSLKRTHRIGQEKSCFYYHFITDKSIEKRIYSSLKKGQDYDLKIFEKDSFDKTGTVL